MADIFISYASEDRSRVEPLARALEHAGWTIWWDPHIPVGKTWRQVIVEELELAKCVLVIWSKLSAEKEWVIEEAEFGKERNIYVPVLIEDIKPPIGFRQKQAAQFAGWRGGVGNPQFQQLIKAIKDVVGHEKTPGQASHTEMDEAELSGPVDQPTAQAEQDAVYAPRGGYELVRIPGGEFLMGSPDSERERHDSEWPQHLVRMPEFYIGRYPVTNEEYGRFLADNSDAHKPKHWRDRSYNQPRQPVVGVSWREAQQYARWSGLMLPSEAQWEYACRAGTQTRYYSGNTAKNLKQVGWYEANSGNKLHPVGEKEPNDFGLYDMHGNVWEWVEDDSHDNYMDAPDDGSAWIDNPRSASRLFRGGNWTLPADLCRSASRLMTEGDVRINCLGIRLVLLPGQ